MKILIPPFRIFGFLFFDGPNASEILKTNRKFTADFQTLAAIKDELKSPTSKISKEGNHFYQLPFI